MIDDLPPIKKLSPEELAETIGRMKKIIERDKAIMEEFGLEYDENGNLVETLDHKSMRMVVATLIKLWEEYKSDRSMERRPADFGYFMDWLKKNK